MVDMFSKGNSTDAFEEPDCLGMKQRWQIIQILPSAPPSRKYSPKLTSKDKLLEGEKMKVESGIEVESIDWDNSIDDRMSHWKNKAYK